MSFAGGLLIIILIFKLLDILYDVISGEAEKRERVEKKEAQHKKEREEAEIRCAEQWAEEHPKTLKVAQAVGAGIEGTGTTLLVTGYAVGKTAQVVGKGVSLIGVGALCVATPVVKGIWYGLLGRD